MSSDASVTKLAIDRACEHSPGEPHNASSGARLVRKLDNLRPHQNHALSLLRKSIKTGHRRPLVQAPTGAGKTLLAAAMVDGARRKHNKVLFVVPALSLIEQTVEAFYSEGLTEVGVI